jgi:hypothetical protein
MSGQASAQMTVQYGDNSNVVASSFKGAVPSLTVTNDPPPEVLYRRGSRDVILGNTQMNEAKPRTETRVQTLVGRKVGDLMRDQVQLDRAVASYYERLALVTREAENTASEYYMLVAIISAQLQAGTTPGNPELVEKWNAASEKLNALSNSAQLLNDIAVDATNEASKAAFLLEAVRSTFGLSGAVKEDHADLTQLEDETNQSIVRISRLLNSANDEINRRTAYLRSERSNMQTLSLAIADGELYGRSLSNSLFRKASFADEALVKPQAAIPEGSSTPLGRRPLAVIRFDRAGVDYEQAVYTAVGQALEKFPAARFDLVAVSTSAGNAAEVALSSTAAKKNGEAVLRSMMQMGVPLERIELSTSTSAGVADNEVHLFIQ